MSSAGGALDRFESAEGVLAGGAVVLFVVGFGSADEELPPRTILGIWGIGGRFGTPLGCHALGRGGVAGGGAGCESGVFCAITGLGCDSGPERTAATTNVIAPALTSTPATPRTRFSA